MLGGFGFDSPLLVGALADWIPGEDHGSHMIGNQFGGILEGYNLLPQHRNLNREAWLQMENYWAKQLRKTPPSVVDVSVKPIYQGDSFHPVGYKVNYIIDGVLQRPQEFVNGYGNVFGP